MKAVSEYEFIFNLNGEIKFIRGLNTSWPHPAEQLKRTDGNDWVYYYVGDDSSVNGIISWLGEYYLPCLPYPSNSIWEKNLHPRSSVVVSLNKQTVLGFDHDDYGDMDPSSLTRLTLKKRPVSMMQKAFQACPGKSTLIL